MIAQMQTRAAGILLHVTSLPSPYGIGDMGSAARRFVDFLVQARQRYWQILPLTPTSPFLGNSPYSSYSAFAGNTLLISPELLAGDGWLRLADIRQGAPGFEGAVDFEAVEVYKGHLLDAAYAGARGQLAGHAGYQAFVAEHGPNWLTGFARFMVLKDMHGGAAWNTWAAEYRRRDADALAALDADRADELTRVCFEQYLFFSQWESLHGYARERGISIIGDLPFYPTFDSADVWENPDMFQLHEGLVPTVVAGVPPDYFSKTGQRWGNPVYDWEALRRDGYGWWMRRMEQNLLLADIVRLDHFRGFAGYWVIDPDAETAQDGHWETGPGEDFFRVLAERFGELPIIAEDLGVITDDVIAVRRAFDLPGMRVLQFSFGHDGGESVNSLHNHARNNVAYSGTHDNNSARGWFEEDLGAEDAERLYAYLGRRIGAQDAAWTLIHLAFMSPARAAIVPMQDVLSLGSEARMNVPSQPMDNWTWRMRPGALSPRVAQRLAHLSELFGRA